MFTSTQLSQWLQQPAPHQSNIPYSAVSIDSRTIAPHALFIAIHGPNFDGHRFCYEAYQKGAIGFVVSQYIPDIPHEHQWMVPDTLKAFQDIASGYRRALHSTQFIALTGSNGKTTTRTMLATLLNAWQSTTATQANLNNTIGVPLQIFNTSAHHQFNVLECGTNQFGELLTISKMAQPNTVIITNTEHAHTAFFKTHDGVIRAKSELLSHLQADGTMIIPFDDRGLDHWQHHYAQFNQITFGRTPEADCYATSIISMPNGHTQFTYHGQDTPPFKVTLPLAGHHQVDNALAAITAALHYQCPVPIIQQSIATLQPIPRRFAIQKGPNQSLLIDDSYNANPASTKAALDCIKTMPHKQKILIFADMLELGADEMHMHREIGTYANHVGIDTLLTLGHRAQQALKTFQGLGQHYDDYHALADDLLNLLNHDTLILLKGSNGMQLDQLIDLIKEGA